MLDLTFQFKADGGIRVLPGAARWLEEYQSKGLVRFLNNDTIEFRYECVKDEFLKRYIQKLH